MFEPDPKRNYIDARKEQVITLLNSTIRAHVAFPGQMSEPTDAYACTFKSGNNYETLLYFHLTKSHTGIVYRWDAGPQPRDGAKNVEKEALNFLESMGFQMDSLHFRKKPAEEQQQLIDTLTCFKPNLDYLKQADQAEADAAANEFDEVTAEAVEAGEAIEEEGVSEIAVESVGEAPQDESSEEAAAPTMEPAPAEPALEAEAEEVELETDTFEEAFEQAVEEEVSPQSEVPEPEAVAEPAPAPEAAANNGFFEETPPALADEAAPEEEEISIGESQPEAVEPAIAFADSDEEQVASAEAVSMEPEQVSEGVVEQADESLQLADEGEAAIEVEAPQPEPEQAAEPELEQAPEPEMAAPAEDEAPEPLIQAQSKATAQISGDFEPLARFIASM